MTIAQRFAELATELGVENFDCKSGNIADVINAITTELGGTPVDSQNIQRAMHALNDALSTDTDDDGETEQEPLTPDNPDNADPSDPNPDESQL